MDVGNGRVVEQVVVAEMGADGRFESAKDGGSNVVRQGRDAAEDVEEEGSRAFLTEEIGFRNDGEVNGMGREEVAAKEPCK